MYADPPGLSIDTLKTEPGEAYTAYHEHLFKLSRIKDRMQTDSGRQMADERHQFMQTYFDQLIAEVEGRK